MSPPGTKLEVDPKVYYQAATNCFDSAAALFDSFTYVFSELGGYGMMAGKDEDGRAWANSYDQSARDAASFFTETYQTLRAYGTALNDIGFEHAKSDASIHGTTQPERPADAVSTATLGPYRLPASAAGGTPEGLAQTAIDVLDAINCPLPDGNTDTLAKAADAWDRLGRVYVNTNAKDKITIAASLFDGVTSTDATQVRQDLKTIEASIGELLTACNQISKSCTDYQASIQELRDEIQGFIEAIVTEAAIDVTITIIATCLTGVGGLIAGAKAVESARRWSTKIKTAVSGWRARKTLQLKGVSDDATAAMSRAKQKITELRERLGGGGSRPKRPGSQLTQQDLDAIGSYTGAGSRDVNLALRTDNVSAAQQVRIDDLNAALNKLPDNKGTVYRGTNLDPEDIAKYQEGGTVTEKAFTSTSTDPSRAFSGNTRFTIQSETGKDVSQYSTAQQAGHIEDEVLFRSSTNFRVARNWTDPNTGITYIDLVEVP
ncbi:hypothetical protein ASD42_27650 [Nocardia sp. Root136]|uniref:ADP-ribosyltransferase n=1 Tax=Nocardia TaxID=1817 RepID=UPI0006F6F4CB|nr:ADP-ribosyltransferase [Nocardia sp. Root136]KQY28443.1 hypothetical protein ASD42_27650 [Nocardia sp. Root136]